VRQHQTIKASDLRPGDLMRLGSGTNYVLISSAAVVGGRVVITAYNGEDPQLNGPVFGRDPDEDVELSGRALGPNDRIEG
jgi:hypothetical protein